MDLERARRLLGKYQPTLGRKMVKRVWKMATKSYVNQWTMTPEPKFVDSERWCLTMCGNMIAPWIAQQKKLKKQKVESAPVAAPADDKAAKKAAKKAQKAAKLAAAAAPASVVAAIPTTSTPAMMARREERDTKKAQKTANARQALKARWGRQKGESDEPLVDGWTAFQHGNGDNMRKKLRSPGGTHHALSKGLPIMKARRVTL
jgi:hypothetical protein